MVNIVISYECVVVDVATYSYLVCVDVNDILPVLLPLLKHSHLQLSPQSFAHLPRDSVPDLSMHLWESGVSIQRRSNQKDIRNMEQTYGLEAIAMRHEHEPIWEALRARELPDGEDPPTLGANRVRFKPAVGIVQVIRTSGWRT